MSCSCGPLKKNIESAAVYGVAKLAISKEASKKRILSQSAIVGVSGYAYDVGLGQSLGRVYAAGSDVMMKSIYQVALLGGADFLMKKKLSMRQLLEGSISVFAANYGVDMLGNA